MQSRLFATLEGRFDVYSGLQSMLARGWISGPAVTGLYAVLSLVAVDETDGRG
jgi:hypothetical protein